MAEPQESYPESATHGARRDAADGDGRAALEAALAEHGEELAALVRSSDEFDELLTTAVLVIASADEAELDELTDSTANLIEAADGLTTEEAAELATDLGESADDLAEALELVVELQRAGHLEPLLDTAATLSALELDAEAVAGLNDLLGAVGEARGESEPVGLLGMLSGLRGRDARAGLGYLLALLKALGRRV